MFQGTISNLTGGLGLPANVGFAIWGAYGGARLWSLLTKGPAPTSAGISESRFQELASTNRDRIIENVIAEIRRQRADLAEDVKTSHTVLLLELEKRISERLREHR